MMFASRSALEDCAYYYSKSQLMSILQSFACVPINRDICAASAVTENVYDQLNYKMSPTEVACDNARNSDTVENASVSHDFEEFSLSQKPFTTSDY